MSARNRILEDLFCQGCTSTEIVSILKDKFSVTLRYDKPVNARLHLKLNNYSLRQVQRILGLLARMKGTKVP